MSIRCLGCMKIKESRPVCEHCGYNENVPNYPHQLPIGTVLQNRYTVGKVLGQGGFGITYIGWDNSLDTPVAVKEYYPASLVNRDCHYTKEVFCNGEGAEGLFAHNRERFLKEAKILAKLSNVPGIVRVQNLFAENNTAYIVMEYVEGIDLKHYIRLQNRVLTVQEAFAVLRPVMYALSKVHEAELVHRDISPDNIMIQKDGSAKLLDFGAAREVADAEVNKELPQSTEAILKHGFAPMEQYQRRGTLGPWTDVYALCATLYYCLTGKVPADAPERIMGSDNVNWRQIPGLTEQQIQTLEKGLALLPESRIRTMRELHNGLFGQTATGFTQVEPKPEPNRRGGSPTLPKAAVTEQKKAQKKPDYPTHTVSLDSDDPEANRRGGSSTLPKAAKTEQKKKKPFGLIAAVLAIVAAVGVFALKPKDTPGTISVPETEFKEATEPANPIANAASEITLWTYPIGDWGNENTVTQLIAAFEKETGIRVSVEYLNYRDGDDKVNAAIEAGITPDLIMEGPERLVAKWGRNGVMADLSDLLSAEDIAELFPAVLESCRGADGALYEYPLVMTAHCMAINKTVFQNAGVMRHLNEQTHTWNSVADFVAAINGVYAYTGRQVGTVFCGGQGGDQGTRALVTNLCGGTFTNPQHTAYTWNSAENAAALEILFNHKGITFDDKIVGGDEISLFYNGTLNMAFCWNIAQQLNPNTANTGAGKTANGDEILFMAFPSDTTPQLCGGVWGFGVFDNHDESRIVAAKCFIKFMCDSAFTKEAVKAANYFAVRDSAEGVDLTGIYQDAPIMDEYKILMPMLGDIYQVTPRWADARTAWWNLLQDIGKGKNIPQTLSQYTDQINATIQ